MANISPTYAQIMPRENSQNLPSDRVPSAPVRFLRGAAALALPFLFCGTASVCHAQRHHVICSDGGRAFNAEFRTGVKVHGGAARNRGWAARVCEGALSWHQQ